ncbi:MAG TPA: imidazole glycerol phosphate synthase subunit HisF [Planctomycetota bacterium]|jgi:cyclase|nr:imidazole glycerol phosphate synthase subunit HisF [Planctomycetota bacterium]
MLTKRIIPCLDVKAGRVVKGVQFQNLADVGDPPELARRYELEGADEIVFLDITATLEARKTMHEIARRTAELLFIPLTIGGGIRTYQDVKATLRAGADKISLNTAAVEHPEVITEASRDFGAQCVVIAIDTKREGGRHRVYTHAGSRPSGLDTVEWAKKAADLGAGEILLTSIDADGTTSGYDLEVTAAVAEAVPIPVIASGGCGSAEHILDVLTKGKADAALAASIFHYGTTTVGAVKDLLRGKGLLIR